MTMTAADVTAADAADRPVGATPMPSTPPPLMIILRLSGVKPSTPPAPPCEGSGRSMSAPPHDPRVMRGDREGMLAELTVARREGRPLVPPSDRKGRRGWKRGEVGAP